MDNRKIDHMFADDDTVKPVLDTIFFKRPLF